MSDIREIADAVVERLQAAGVDASAHVPTDLGPPTLIVYDGDGNEVYRREVGPLPPYIGPTMTVEIEHSEADGPTWTDLGVLDE